MSWGLMGCSGRAETPQLSKVEAPSEPVAVGKLVEVAPPQIFTQLRSILDQYQPQVSILNPKPDQVLQDTSVSVQLKVQDLPLFKAPDLDMGPHLHLLLDNEPYQDVYAVDQPIILENLSPGTHTLRVFASRPWHESFKNEGAYAQTTFHIFTKTQENKPDPKLPLLSYSRPQGDYGAEPILLDFYLTNAPLHLIAQENSDDDIHDWRIRITVNGQTFLLDNWQSLYLKGFNEGNNWVQLQFLDEKGNPVKNAFNNTVRLITYHPKGQDTLSKLVRGELTTQQARAIVDPNFKPTEVKPSLEVEPQPITESTSTEVKPSLEIEPEPIIELTPTEVKPSLEVEPKPIIELTPTEVKPSLEVEPKPIIESTPTEVEPKPIIESTPTEVEPKPIIESTPTDVKPSSTLEQKTLPEQANEPVETKPIESNSNLEDASSNQADLDEPLNLSPNAAPESFVSKFWKPKWLDDTLNRFKLN